MKKNNKIDYEVYLKRILDKNYKKKDYELYSKFLNELNEKKPS
jgi:hypothetical protein